MKAQYLTDVQAKRRWEAQFFVAFVLGVLSSGLLVLLGTAVGVNPFFFTAALPFGALVSAVLVSMLDVSEGRRYRAALSNARDISNG